MEKYGEAEKAVTESLRIYQNLLPKCHHLISTAYFNLALIEDADNRDNEALQHYHNALKMDSELGNVDNIILTAEYIADIYQRNEMFEDEKIYRDYIEELLEKYE